MTPLIHFDRQFSMPNSQTFSVNPIKEFLWKYLKRSKVSVDPYARNTDWATYTNDLNPETSAQYHLDALDFIALLKEKGVKADLIIFDPPYSPRQISECYKGIGLPTNSKLTSSAFYAEPKNALVDICTNDAIVLSFCWNSNGMGLKRGFVPLDIKLIPHGGWHNDTICMAEKRMSHHAIPPIDREVLKLRVVADVPQGGTWFRVDAPTHNFYRYSLRVYAYAPSPLDNYSDSVYIKFAAKPNTGLLEYLLSETTAQYLSLMELSCVKEILAPYPPFAMGMESLAVPPVLSEAVTLSVISRWPEIERELSRLENA